MSKSAGHEDGLLTFDWPSRQRSSWLLTALIFLSIALHFAVFFLFKVEPIETIGSPLPAPAVGLLTRFDQNGKPSVENAILLNWVAANDPALTARTPVVMPAGLLDVPYRPSYLTPRTAPHGLPPDPATVQFPSPRDPIELITNSQPKDKTTELQQQPRVTTIKFAEALAEHAPAGITPPPVPSSEAPLQSTQLLLGVAGSGEVHFVFPQTSSGLGEADTAATTFIRGLKFSPLEAPITWGMVDVYWGDPTTTPSVPPSTNQ